MWSIGSTFLSASASGRPTVPFAWQGKFVSGSICLSAAESGRLTGTSAGQIPLQPRCQYSPNLYYLFSASRLHLFCKHFHSGRHRHRHIYPCLSPHPGPSAYCNLRSPCLLERFQVLQRSCRLQIDALPGPSCRHRQPRSAPMIHRVSWLRPGPWSD